MVLREIQNFVSDGQVKDNHKILHSIEFEPIPDDLIAREISRIALKRHHNEILVEGNIIVGSYGNRQSVPLDELKSALKNPQNRLAQFCQWFLAKKMLCREHR